MRNYPLQENISCEKYALENHENLTRTFFDRRSQGRGWSEFGLVEKKQVEELLKDIQIEEGDLILEPGCGAGRFTPYLSRLAGTDGLVFSFDISEKMIKRAKERSHYPNTVYMNSSVHHIPLPDNSVNVAVCFNSFHNFSCPLLAVKEMSRVLKKGGMLSIIFTEPVREKDGIPYLPREILRGRSIPIHSLEKLLQFFNLSVGKTVLSESLCLLNARSMV